jgi:hypothetical protein
MFIKSRILVACAASVLALCACTPKDPGVGAASTAGGTAATVNGIAISENRVD